MIEGGIHPSVREWTCEACGTPHLRDENAGKNGLARLLSSHAGNIQVPRSGPAGFRVERRCRLAFRPDGRWEVGQLGPSATRNQIAPSGLTGGVEGLPLGGRGSRRPDLRLTQSPCG